MPYRENGSALSSTPRKVLRVCTNPRYTRCGDAPRGYLVGMTVAVPPGRAAAAREVAAVLTPGRHVVLTTHVNSDGDGVGSEVGLWHLLHARGVAAIIANPTPIPERFHFLLPDGADK